MSNIFACLRVIFRTSVLIKQNDITICFPLGTVYILGQQVFSACCLLWKACLWVIWAVSVYKKRALSPTSVVLSDRKRTVHFWAAKHFYSIANFVASWLRWLQIISNDSKWLHLTYQTHRDSFGVLSDHLESFKSKGDKIIYTINMQRS